MKRLVRIFVLMALRLMIVVTVLAWGVSRLPGFQYAGQHPITDGCIAGVRFDAERVTVGLLSGGGVALMPNRFGRDYSLAGFDVECWFATSGSRLFAGAKYSSALILQLIIYAAVSWVLKTRRRGKKTSISRRLSNA